jgi:DNA-binding CsgD family transcriptional regulator
MIPAVPAHIDAARIVGRDRETALIRESLSRLDDGGEALLVRGEAGIGKSELLTYAADLAAAQGARVLRAAGVESESELPFAGLHQLFVPLAAGAGLLPTPQGDALLAAFGAAPRVSPPPLFLVALGALNLISDGAGAGQLVLVIEDAHWLDSSSAAALAFIARRIESEPVLLVAAIRDGFPTGFDAAGLPELRLERLDDVASAALLDARAPGLPPQTRSRILNAAAGNPLALVELPLNPDPAPGLPERSSWLSLTDRLEHAFSARAALLDPPTRALLLVLAADEGDAITEVIPAARSLIGDCVGIDDLTPAIAAGLIESDGDRVRFRHPLMRSATYQSATVADRHAAHAALSAIVVEEDRRVWHIAAASVAPAEPVAAQLETLAARAQRRGAVSTGIVALERAASLSEASSDQGRRLLAAAELGFELGRDDVVARLVGQAEALQLTPPAQAYLLWLRGVFDGGRAGGASRFEPLIESGRRLAGRSAEANDLAVKLLWSAATQFWWSDPSPDIGRRIVEAARLIPAAADDPRMLAIEAFAAPVECAATVTDGLARSAGDAILDADAARILGTAANAIGAFDAAAPLLAVAAGGLRDQGRLGLLARALTQQAWSAVHRVDLGVAVPVADEAERLTRETAQPTMRHISRAIQSTAAALRGDRATAEEYAAEAERYGVPIGARALLAMARHARGLGALADGQPNEAYEHLARIHDPGDPAYHSFIRCFTVADLVDAATRSGRGDAATPIVAELEAVAAAAPIPVLHAGLRYARPLLANDETAEALFDSALQADPAWPFLRARTQIALGEWLRRHRRVAASRPHLRAARDAFDALGAIPWSERARQELRASGETSRSRMPEARDQLTPQELQIAQLAAGGLSNQEIGQRLFVSHRTVSTHLYRLYPKLGITSRAELRDALGTPTGDGAPALEGV